MTVIVSPLPQLQVTRVPVISLKSRIVSFSCFFIPTSPFVFFSFSPLSNPYALFLAPVFSSGLFWAFFLIFLQSRCAFLDIFPVYLRIFLDFSPSAHDMLVFSFLCGLSMCACAAFCSRVFSRLFDGVLSLVIALISQFVARLWTARFALVCYDMVPWCSLCSWLAAIALLTFTMMFSDFWTMCFGFGRCSCLSAFVLSSLLSHFRGSLAGVTLLGGDFALPWLAFYSCLFIINWP